MKAITLHQPWASLCVLPGPSGRPFKPYETRSWKRVSLIGERIAIHAGKHAQHIDDCNFKIWDALEALRFSYFAYFKKGEALPPLGVIVGSAVVKRFFYCSPPRFLTPCSLKSPNKGMNYHGPIPPEALPFGDFSEGRWAWELTDVEYLTKPIPCKGAQGIWTLPASVEEAYLQAENRLA